MPTQAGIWWSRWVRPKGSNGRANTKSQGRKPRKAQISQPAPKEAPPPQNALDRFCVLLAQGTSIATELRAGLATFLTMAYIMFVGNSLWAACSFQACSSLRCRLRPCAPG